MRGYVAVTHHRWFEHLAPRLFWEEVNFWRPSAYHSFNGPPGSPFFFKLKAPHNAIGGFGLVTRFDRLPDWFAWECFGEANGAASFEEMEQRLNEIRTRNKFVGSGPIPQIGCILLGTAIFFPRDLWIPQPSDWAPRNLTYQGYDLESGEGQRIWQACQERLGMLRVHATTFPVSVVAERAVEQIERQRFGIPRLITPRLGQGTFRVAVTDAYGRACAITGEHSLPALEAAHIKSYTRHGGPHEVGNGLLLRADLHRLFDKGYITVTPERRVRVSPRLRADYENGKTYYPMDDRELRMTTSRDETPSQEFLRWHNDNTFLR